MLNKIVYLFLLTFCSSALSYKILMICGPPSKSHFNLCSGVVNTLVDKNHDVTFIAGFTVPRPKYREVFVEIDNMLELMPSSFQMANMSLIESIGVWSKLAPIFTNETLSHPKVKKILNNKSENFDLIIIEYFMNHHMLGLGVKYNCPTILLAPIGINMMPWLITTTGNSLSLATIPSGLTTYPYKMNIWQRVVNTIFYIFGKTIECFTITPLLRKLYAEYFPDESKILPFDDLGTKVSMVISNTHHSIGPIRPLLPNVIEIGGYHIEEPAPLPQNLKEIMDDAKDGVIFFSLGSIVKTSEMTEEFRKIIINTLSKLKETVLWKFDDEIPNLPKNIITQKWLPQTSILAHPNIKLFITHGGLLSCTEATHFGVPILILPVFGDQYHNSKVFSDRGQGISLPYYEITEEKFGLSVIEMLTNSKYAQSSKKVSELYHDRPVKPRELLAFAVEHVIKTGGAPHLTPPRLPRYSLLLLDVIAILLSLITGITILFGYCSKSILKRFWRCHNKSAEPKNQLKSKIN